MAATLCTSGWPRASPRARSRCSPTGPRSWATRWPRRSPRLDRSAARPGLARRGRADRGGAARRARRGPLDPGRTGRTRTGRHRRGPAGPRRGHGGRDRGGGARGRVAAAVPRPGVHDAAVRDGGRGPGADLPRGVRGGAGGLKMTILVVTGTGTEIGKTVTTAAVAAAALAGAVRWPCSNPPRRASRRASPATSSRCAAGGRGGDRRPNWPDSPSRWRPRPPPAGPA